MSMSQTWQTNSWLLWKSYTEWQFHFSKNMSNDRGTIIFWYRQCFIHALQLVNHTLTSMVHKKLLLLYPMAKTLLYQNIYNKLSCIWYQACPDGGMVKATDLQAEGPEFNPQRSHIFFIFFPLSYMNFFAWGGKGQGYICNLLTCRCPHYI